MRTPLLRAYILAYILLRVGEDAGFIAAYCGLIYAALPCNLHHIVAQFACYCQEITQLLQCSADRLCEWWLLGRFGM